MTGFEELPGLATLAAAVPVIAVLGFWLATLRSEIKEWREEYKRLESEYRQALKDWSGMRQNYLQNESFMAGRMFQAGDDLPPTLPRRTDTGPLTTQPGGD